MALLICALMTVWGGLALWYRFPGPEGLRLVIGCSFVLLGSSTLLAQFRSSRFKALVIFALAFAGLLGWWSTIEPAADGDWSPDVARQVTGQIEGDKLTLTNVRNFEWRTRDDFTPIWMTRTYDLSKMQSVDLFLSYWSGPEMAHFILSFGFGDDEFLAWSVEVRREIGGGFSPVADLFKENALVIVAATERDIIGLRTNVRKEDVQLYRLRFDPARARALLEEYVRDANALSQRPHWYNSLTTNCTTVVAKMMKAVGNGPPLDWRIVVNGYLPEFGYERGALNTAYSIEDLRELGKISARAQEFGLSPGFSTAIRANVPKAPQIHQ